jgi:tripartite-type tricarboxylate transporter receptor subunit TctC
MNRPLSPSIRRRGLLALAGASALAPAASFAQAWPTKPIKVICNFPPGSSPDALVRAVSGPVSQALGQPMVIDNRAGASGIIGAEQVAHAEPDGHTFLMTAGSTITTNPPRTWCRLRGWRGSTCSSSPAATSPRAMCASSSRT